MGKFMRLVVTEPNVVRLPFVVDSAQGPVIEEGLMCVQGRNIVNPISLQFDDKGVPEAGQALHSPRRCRGRDSPHEQGQAATLKDTVRFCQRGCRLMGQENDFPLEGIIYYRNMLSTSTVFPGT